MKSPLPTLLPALLSALAILLSNPLAADEAAVKRRLEQQLPNFQIDKVTPTPYPGLYEVFAGGALLYTDEQASYLIQGSLIDPKTRQNLSTERLRQLTTISFEQLPLELAIKIVKGDGRRRLAVFEDPDCPFCRQLEQELTKVDNVTLYIFLYPIESLHRGATAKSRKIWCAEDRTKAWQEAAQKGIVAENPGSCETPLEKIAAFGRRMRITGTPTLFFGDGNRVAGAMPAARVEQLLGGQDSAAPSAAPSAPEKPEK